MAEPDPQSPLKTQPEPRKLKSLRSGSKVALKTREFNLIPLDCFNPAMLPTNANFYVNEWNFTYIHTFFHSV